MNRNKAVLSLAGALLFIVASACADESLTITTYYPSPQGVYKQLKLHPHDTPPVCNAANEGWMYYNNTTSTFDVCTDVSGVYAYRQSGLWALNGVNLTVANTGWRLGVGTATPENSEGWAGVLNVHGSGNSKMIATTTTGSIQTGVWSHSGGFYSAPAGGIIGTRSNHPLSIVTNAASKVTVLASGNVGINTTNPQATLQVNGTVTITNQTTLGCRDGFWPVADGRVCMESTLRGPTNIHNAIGACKAVAPGCRVCKHTDFQQACGSGYNPYTTTYGWYGDHGVGITAPYTNWDDEYGTWNGLGCSDNNDGPAYDHAEAKSYNYRCCY